MAHGADVGHTKCHGPMRHCGPVRAQTHSTCMHRAVAFTHRSTRIREGNVQNSPARIRCRRRGSGERSRAAGAYLTTHRRPPGSRAADETDSHNHRGDQGDHGCHQHSDLQRTMSHGAHFLLSSIPTRAAGGADPSMRDTPVQAREARRRRGSTAAPCCHRSVLPASVPCQAHGGHPVGPRVSAFS